ncbi:hypothetical protein BGZ76_011811 [Entomortierella beljakovae]|nr:hypothetical protein BGZ76_011811 [Entomortierella beljakovae]
MTSGVVFDVAPEHIAYALLGCFIIFFGLVSLFVKEKLFISEAFVATVFGIIIGPYAIGVFDPISWKEYDKVTLEFTRIVIAVQVMAAGVSLPRSYMLKEKRSLFMMIVPLMCLMWLTSSLFIWAIIPNIDFIEAMVLGACVTPTDPVLSNSVVKGRFAEKHVPPRIRYLLSAESGINDGMGLPFLYLGLYLLRERTVGGALAKWFYMIWAYQILLSVVLGGLIGAAARKLVKGAKNRNLIDKESFLVFSIALALAVTGCVSILASDDLLAVFIAGNVFAWDDWFSNEIAEAHIQEIIDMLLNLACFVYIGASIPFSKFHDLMLELSAWRLVALAIVLFMFRRLPFVVAMKRFIPALATYREAAFAGWFGPIGVGALYLSKVAAEMTEPNNMGDNPYNIERLLRVRSVIFPVVMFMIFSSVLIHGITVPLLHLQYKYTRTWSRKREESSHVVTRLPHINIGDDIVLRPPGGAGASNPGGHMDGEGPSPRTVGYGNMAGYGAGFGTVALPDLSRVSTGNTRTLDDVVQEMRDAKGLRSPTYSSPNSSSENNSNVVYPLTSVGVGSPRYNQGESTRRGSSCFNNNGLNIRTTDVRANSTSESSGHSSTTVNAAPSTPLASYSSMAPEQEIYDSHQASGSAYQEGEEIEESGLISIVTHDNRRDQEGVINGQVFYPPQLIP